MQSALNIIKFLSQGEITEFYTEFTNSEPQFNERCVVNWIGGQIERYHLLDSTVP